MRVTDVLRSKGDLVVTIPPEHTVSQLLDALAEHGVGALVVSADGSSVDGIVSERDVVRRLQQHGSGLLGAPVSEIMTSQVHTCGSQTDLDDLMRLMTDRRFRHVPIVDDARLVGIVSIGDVVKHKIDLLETERDQLTAYIHQ